ncbi:MAG TPA: zf-HC2 domain-containing protein [Planctomycetota bacterium]|nr:zf-HC2 domain-containing protein [Planctomycetota bacterium]
MSGCPDFFEKLEAYSLGFLSGPEREAVDAHLRSCASCRGERDDICATLGLLEQLPGQVALSGAASRGIAGISNATTPRRPGLRWGVLVAAAGWLIAVGVGSAALWGGLRKGAGPDPRMETLVKRVESQATLIDELQKQLREDRARQMLGQETLLAALQARVDRQDRLLQSLEEQGRRWTETSTRVAHLSGQLDAQERQIQTLGEGSAMLLRRSAEDSERLAQVLRQIDSLRPKKDEQPKPELAATPEPPSAPVPGATPPEAPRSKNPIDAAQGFLWSVFRDRGGALNQKIRDYKEDLNRSYDNR